MVKLNDGKYGSNNYQAMGQDFMLGFFSDLAGGATGQLASGYALPKIGKGLLNKFSIGYKTVTNWLGGGLKPATNTYSHTSIENGVARNIMISAIQKMEGWAPGKIAIIGRSQDNRAVPFADKLHTELGVPVLQIKKWSNRRQPNGC